jgi:hypothetical protein
MNFLQIQILVFGMQSQRRNNMLYKGSTKIGSFQLGSTKIGKLYKGSTLVYQSKLPAGQVIFESSTAGTYTVTIPKTQNYYIDLVGGGGGSSLPTQTGHSGEFLTTDGTDASWGAVSQVPSTTGATQGDVLTVDSGGDAAWAAAPSGLPDQTGQSGKFLTTDGTDASWSDKPLVNNSTSNVGALAIGTNAEAAKQSVAIGFDAKVSPAYLTYSIAIGRGASVSANNATALGANAICSATRAIQLGAGTNSDANTFKVYNGNGNFELMNANGNLPADRLASTTGLADGNYRLRLVMASGVPTLEWVAE